LLNLRCYLILWFLRISFIHSLFMCRQWSLQFINC
jgi:hypothetical protein